jgi:hypothetical protein
MTALRLSTMLPVVALSLVATPCAAQRGGPRLTTGLPAAHARVGPTIPPLRAQGSLTRKTTFLERFAYGVGAGFLGAVAASAIVDGDGDEWLAFPLIGVASATGVMLVTSAHEGARPWSTLLGTAIAMTIPALVFATVEDGGEGPTGFQLGLGFAILLSAPLGAAAGHGLGAS